MRAVDHHLGGARPGVVVRAHAHAVGAGRHDGEQVALAQRERRGRGRGSRRSRRPGRRRRSAASRPARGADRHDLVPGVVERRAQQVVHRRVDDGEVLLGAVLQVLDAGQQQRRRCPTSERPGSSSSFCGRAGEPRPSSGRRDSAAVGGGRFVAVADAEAAAEVEVVQRDALARRARRPARAPCRAPSTNGADLGQLRADVAVDADHVEAAASARRAGRARSASSRATPNLFSLQAGRDVRMGLRVDVGIHAERRPARGCPARAATRSRRSSSAADSTLKQRMPAVQRLRASRPRSCRRRRTRPCAGSPPAASTRASSPPETMSKPAPSRASSVEDGEVGVGLHRVADQVVAAGERRGERAERAPRCAARE